VLKQCTGVCADNRHPAQPPTPCLFLSFNFQVVVTLEHKGTRVYVATSHLESFRDNMKLRQRQLREGLQRLEAQFEQDADLCLLVGDLNL